MNRYGAGSVYFPARVALLLAFAFGLAISSTLAETPGVTETSVLIGSYSALDGPVSFLGRQTVISAAGFNCRRLMTATIPTRLLRASSA